MWPNEALSRMPRAGLSGGNWPGRGDAGQDIGAVLAAVLRHVQEGELPLFGWTLGMAHGEFGEMIEGCFPEVAALENVSPQTHRQLAAMAPPLFRQMAVMLLHQRNPEADIRQVRWLSGAMAAACFGHRHLWQDLGLGSRAVLFRLMREYFPALAKANAAGRPWKRFLFAELGRLLGTPLLLPPGCLNCERIKECHTDRRLRN